MSYAGQVGGHSAATSLRNLVPQLYCSTLTVGRAIRSLLLRSPSYEELVGEVVLFSLELALLRSSSYEGHTSLTSITVYYFLYQSFKENGRAIRSSIGAKYGAPDRN
jgi:hypothetical protein